MENIRMILIEWLQKNMEWIFSGIGVSAVAIFITLFKKKNIDKSGVSTVTINNSNYLNNNHLTEKNIPPIELNNDKTNVMIQEKLTKILFVDDDVKFKVIKILKTAGWNNVKIIKDVPALDCFDVKNSDILFIDIQGVGKALGFSDEGLGLALSIKIKYPNKKVVIYSAQTTGERFHEALRSVDYSLPKNSEPYEFIRLIEECSQELNQ